MNEVIVNNFGLTTIPFQKDININNLFTTEAYNEVFTRLLFACKTQDFAILTAPPGCGKSTMVRRLAQALDPKKYQFIYISDSKLTPRWLYNNMLEQLGLNGYLFRGDGKKVLHQQLKYLREVHKKNIVCCVDESHLLSRETIEETRFLLNNEMDSKSPLALILIGQSELKQKLRSEKYLAVRQRVSFACELPRLDEMQIKMYIAHHLKAVGYKEETLPFDDEALNRICDYSGGTLRLINKVCLQTMLYAASQNKITITGAIAKAIIDKELF